MTYDDYEEELNQINSDLRKGVINEAQAYRYTENLQDAWEANGDNDDQN